MKQEVTAQKAIVSEHRSNRSSGFGADIFFRSDAAS
jgi:hypothetical protein